MLLWQIHNLKLKPFGILAVSCNIVLVKSLLTETTMLLASKAPSGVGF